MYTNKYITVNTIIAEESPMRSPFIDGSALSTINQLRNEINIRTKQKELARRKLG